MVLAEKILKKNPGSHVVCQMLSLKHPSLNSEEWRGLANLVKKSGNLHYLDVSGMNIYSLKPLQGTNLQGLNCSFNRLTDLNGIEAMKLNSLDVRGNPLQGNSAGQGELLNQIPCLKISDPVR